MEPLCFGTHWRSSTASWLLPTTSLLCTMRRRGEANVLSQKLTLKWQRAVALLAAEFGTSMKGKEAQVEEDKWLSL